MAKVLQIAADGSGVVVNANATTYIPCANTSLVTNATETPAQITYRTAGVISNLYILVTANTVSADSTLKVRINGADGNGSVTIPSNTTGKFEDAVNTDSISAGDEVNYSLVTGATGTSLTMTAVTSIFDASSNTVIRLACQGASLSVSSQTSYAVLAGFSTVNASAEVTAQVRMKMAGTAKNFFANVVATGSANNTLRFRKNTADGNQVITVIASTTGLYEDTSNTDTVVVDDLVNYRLITAASGATLTMSSLGIEFENTSDLYTTITGVDTGTMTFTGGTTRYVTLGGRTRAITTEAPTTVEANVDATFSNMQLLVSVNSTTTDSTLRFRKNASDGNLTVTVTAATTGYFQDTSNSDSVVAGDEINYGITMGTGVGLIIRHFSVVGQSASAAPTFIPIIAFV